MFYVFFLYIALDLLFFPIYCHRCKDSREKNSPWFFLYLAFHLNAYLYVYNKAADESCTHFEIPCLSNSDERNTSELNICSKSKRKANDKAQRAYVCSIYVVHPTPLTDALSLSTMVFMSIVVRCDPWVCILFFFRRWIYVMKSVAFHARVIRCWLTKEICE